MMVNETKAATVAEVAVKVVVVEIEVVVVGAVIV